MVLKPNMVISGKKCATKATPEQVAEATLRTLKRQVPSAVPGIAFLSGRPESHRGDVAFELDERGGPFAVGLDLQLWARLQEDALNAWGGKAATVVAGQQALANRAKLNGLAAGGTYKSSMEKSAA
jgi:fructose-bisphosphate aldolase class I